MIGLADGITEPESFRMLKTLVEPAVRAGCWSPGLFPTGLIVLETTGARSGTPRRTPLLATVFDGCVFIGTVRGTRSQWAKNLRARPEARYWLGGREHRGHARVFGLGAPAPGTNGLPPLARALAETYVLAATRFGWIVAILSQD